MMKTIKENKLRLISVILSTYLIVFGLVGESYAALSSTLADYYYSGLELSGYLNNRGPVSVEMGQISANSEEQFTGIQFTASNTKSGTIPRIDVQVWNGSQWVSYTNVGGKAQYYDKAYDKGAWVDVLGNMSETGAPYTGTTYRIFFNSSYSRVRFMGYWDSGSSTYTGNIKANSITVSRSGLVASESKVQQAVDAANAAKTSANTAATNASNAYSAANTAANNANNAYNTLIKGASNNGKSLTTTYDKANNAATQATNAATQATNAANNTLYNSKSAAYWAYLAANNAETDTTPPTVNLTGLNGATCTTNSSFTVVVSASDNKSGQLLAQAKVGSGAWGSWTNVPGNLPVTLPSMGAHTITVQVKDAAGNISTANMTAFRL